MKYILVIICSIILPILSMKDFHMSLPFASPKNVEITPICINCKFFRNNILTHNRFGKCSLFPIEDNNEEYLVTGITNINDYSYCSIARKYDDMCGKEGKQYKNKKSNKRE